MADDIYLLENGSIIEYGSHKELMQNDRTYADMFIKQAESYLQEVV
jgi:ATP-binding cassette subfamily B protein